MSKLILDQLELEWEKPDLKKWDQLIKRSIKCKSQKKENLILIIGKYTKLADSYLSVTKAVEAAALETLINVKI